MVENKSIVFGIPVGILLTLIYVIVKIVGSGIALGLMLAALGVVGYIILAAAVGFIYALLSEGSEGGMKMFVLVYSVLLIAFFVRAIFVIAFAYIAGAV